MAVPPWGELEGPIRLGISSCLLGEPVRYDGQQKLDHFLRDTLGTFVEWVSVCPEVECGLPVPREAMRLVGDPERPRLVTVCTGVDHTQRMRSWAARRVAELEAQDLCGFVFKSGSPSSGMERVKVYSDQGMPRKVGAGLFAHAFREHFPLLATEEEGRLHDPALRENFIERVFTYWRWRATVHGGRTRGRLVDFHTRNKLLILAHSPQIYREMGRIVAGAKDLPIQQVYERYQERLAEALKRKATPRKNANVLQHALGYFKKQLDFEEKHELLEVIDRYRLEQLPLIVPITLLSHYVRKYRQGYLGQQTYLNPHPIELRLRNHV